MKLNLGVKYLLCYVLACHFLTFFLSPKRGYFPEAWQTMLSTQEHFRLQVYIVYALLFIVLRILQKKLNKLNFVFCSGMFFSAVTFAYLTYFTHGAILKDIIFNDPNDTFMDYYNCIAIGESPYKSAWIAVYPPLSMAYFAILGHMSTSEAMASWHELAVKIRGSQIGMTVFGLYLTITYSMLVCFWYELKKGNAYEKVSFILAMLVSVPFIFSLERGNNVILTMLCIGHFVCFYKHPNRKIQIASFVCLAIAVAMKLSPAIFSLLLLRERRYKDFLLLMLIELAVVFLPFYYFKEDMLVQIKLMALNIAKSTEFYTEALFPTHFIDANKLFLMMFSDGLSKAIKLGITIVGLGEVLFIKKIQEWKAVTILAVLAIIIPAFSAIYSLVYMAIPLMLFLDKGDEARDKFDFLYTLFFIGIFCFIPNFANQLKASTLIECVCIIGLLLLIEIQELFQIKPITYNIFRKNKIR